MIRSYFYYSLFHLLLRSLGRNRLCFNSQGLVKENGVTEVFWYGCPACFAYEEVLDEIRERRPDVKIDLLPLWDEPTAKLITQ